MGGEDELLPARRLVALQYFARLPPRGARFQWPPPSSLLAIQDVLVNDLALDKGDDGHAAAGDVRYKKTFCKELITRLESAVEACHDDEQEVSGEVLQAYALLMAANSSSASGPSSQTVTYYHPSSRLRVADGLFAGWGHVTLREEGSTISRGTTGLKTWEASLRLAAHLLARPESIQGDLRILELGSGSGLLGILIAKEAPQSQVHLTDLDGVVLERLHDAVQENLPDAPNVTVAALDWLDVADASSASHRRLCSMAPHRIFAADIVYDPDLFEPLCTVLRCALGSGRRAGVHEPYALIASTMRNAQTYSLFLTAIEKHGLALCEEPLVRPQVNLATGAMSSNGTTADVEVFVSTHDTAQDGPVKLIRVTLLE